MYDDFCGLRLIMGDSLDPLKEKENEKSLWAVDHLAFLFNLHLGIC